MKQNVLFSWEEPLVKKTEKRRYTCLKDILYIVMITLIALCSVVASEDRFTVGDTDLDPLRIKVGVEAILLPLVGILFIILYKKKYFEDVF